MKAIKPEVQLGAQVWMSKNLDVSIFRSGDPIPKAARKSDWAKATRTGKPVWADVGFDPKNRPAFGRIYNSFAVQDPRGLAPDVWRIPAASDWDALIAYLDGDNYNGETRPKDWVRAGMSQAGKVLKSQRGWGKTRCKGTNDAGFGALPGGLCSPTGVFSGGGVQHDARCQRHGDRRVRRVVGAYQQRHRDDVRGPLHS